MPPGRRTSDGDLRRLRAAEEPRRAPGLEGPATDLLGDRAFSSWGVLLLIWLAFVCGSQGTSDGSPGPGQPPQIRHQRQTGHGTWTPWGSWSACSSTCGDGASFRTRRCIRFPEEEACRGKARQYRVCRLDACPADSVPFRDIQCSLYNGKLILESQAPYRWVPFYGAPNLCDLNCLAEGHNFYYTFGRVLDGTRCSLGSSDLCISGRCLRPGCDGILGSDAQTDACGVCNGRNESCVFVQHLFRAAFPTSGFFGYKNVTRIPAGARHIQVTDRSRNYLALMNANRRYVINGDWAIDGPGVYEVAGTKVRYSRTADAHESFEADGPTHEDLLVMVLFQEPNPGIEYQYWITRERLYTVQGDASPLHQTQGSQASEEALEDPRGHLPATAASHIQSPRGADKRELRPEGTPEPTRGNCRKCETPKGKSRRIQHYCSSDFVFRARILSKRYLGLETRYDVQVKHTYRNRFPLVHREYVWVSNTCDCPLLTERREYVLMARRHVNYEHTLNRILLQRDSYARPWSPREDLQLRDAARLCLQSGTV